MWLDNFSKRKAAKDAAGADGAAKRAKKASGAEQVGCVVAVPAWKFGAQWAAHHGENSFWPNCTPESLCS